MRGAVFEILIVYQDGNPIAVSLNTDKEILGRSLHTLSTANVEESRGFGGISRFGHSRSHSTVSHPRPGSWLMQIDRDEASGAFGRSSAGINGAQSMVQARLHADRNKRQLPLFPMTAAFHFSVSSVNRHSATTFAEHGLSWSSQRPRKQAYVEY